MREFALDALVAEMDAGKKAWHEFLRVPALSMGIYRLKAGDADQQTPHTEDEVYYIISGRASFRAGDRQIPAKAGTVLFVERAAEHRFFDIQEDLTILVFFAPAENSLRPTKLPSP